MKNKILFFFSFLQFSGFGQDSTQTSRPNEIGFSINRYVPDLKTEDKPFFYSLEFRHKWLEREKYDHFLTLRACGNYNRQATFKPNASKLYLGIGLGYFLSSNREGSPWHFSWGASINYYRFKQNITPIAKNPYNPIAAEPYANIYGKISLAPRVAVSYDFSEKFYAQAILAVDLGTKYFGDTDQLKNNNSGTFSSQFPALALFYRF